MCGCMSGGEGLKAEMKGLAQLVSPGLSHALSPWRAGSRLSLWRNREEGYCGQLCSVDVGDDAHAGGDGHVLQVEGGARCR